jgi:predicted phage terminase large subunit-like protein
MKINKIELNTFLRRDFVAFAERCFYELNPNTRYLHNWHIDAIADALEKCRSGSMDRLAINLPPRSLKSHLISIAFVAWLLGHDPSAQIIAVSYAQDLSNKLAADSRSVMSSAWYRDLFPLTQLAGLRQAVHDFSTTSGGFRLATSIGGVLTGRGADYIIIDDPLRPEAALSETQRLAINSWFDHTLVSRLNDKRYGKIILIMQRLHEDDLVGHVLQQGGWYLLKFAAIAPENENHVIDTPYGKKTFARREGEALHPEREPLEVLAKIREVQGEYNFCGQYLQDPAPLGGGMIKVGWFRTYSRTDLPSKFDCIVQSWDTANKPTELSDFSVCSTWGVKEKCLYLLHIFRKRVGYPDLKRAVWEQAQTFAAKTVLIEDRASGTQLIQEMIEDGMQSVQRYQPAMDKVMRMHSVTSTIENGFVYVPESAEWLAEYLHELATFPKGKFDDQVDSTSQALDWFKDDFFKETFGVIEYYNKLANSISPPKDLQKTRGTDSNFTEEMKCPNCAATCVIVCSGQLRCNQCGHQWWPGGKAPEIPRISRADFFSRHNPYSR